MFPKSGNTDLISVRKSDKHILSPITVVMWNTRRWMLSIKEDINLFFKDHIYTECLDYILF